MNRFRRDPDCRTVLFDLDGTLSDPGLGFIRSIRYALSEMDRQCPDDAVLAGYVGPPLRESFREILGPDASAAELDQMIALYRQRYRKTGLYENEAYPGIDELLRELAAAGVEILVATAKPTVFAARIIEHFGWRELFCEVYGSELDGRMSDKAELLEHILDRHGLAARECVMVGDRRHDMIAAGKNAVPAIGVLWGYGSADELTAAGASDLAARPGELPEKLVLR